MFHGLNRSIRRALPTTCIVCGQNADADHSICHECGWELPKLGECCRRCGIELSGTLVTDSCCTSCQLSPPSFDSCTCAFPYVSPIDKLVPILSFQLASILAIPYREPWLARSMLTTMARPSLNCLSPFLCTKTG